MRCKKANILLSAFIDRELGKRDTALLRAHLDKCSHCGEKLSELEEYKRLANILQKKPAPVKLKEAVWQALDERNQSRAAKKRLALSSGMTIFWTAAASIAIIITITLIPPDIFKPDIIETNYYTQAEKGGKGPPSESTRNKKGGRGGKNESGEKDNSLSPEETAVRNLLTEQGGKLNSISYFEDTQEPSRIELTIPAASFEEFREEYNKLQGNNPIPETKIKKSQKVVPLIINFPSRAFLSGDFNADGFDDLLVQLTGGTKSGSILLSPNDAGGNFNIPIEIDISEQEGLEIIEGRTISGDFNGDGFDDILMFKSNKQILHFVMFVNIKGGKLKKAVNFEISNPGIKHQDEILLLSGDINGDGKDDPVLHQRIRGRNGAWWFLLNRGNLEFNDPIELETGHSGWENTDTYLPFISDINGDGFYETGIYGRGGERDARWYSSLNNGDLNFSSEKLITFGKSGMAFQGDYFPLFGDFNGDGLTDIIVKYGSPDTFSNWYMMTNHAANNFSLGKDVDFNGKKDFDF